MKEAISTGGNSKLGVNGMNMLSLALQAPPAVVRPPTSGAPQPLQARAAIVENPNMMSQSATISLASLQPPLMTMPPLQPRPATTGALDLMLPLQPKLLPGYNSLQNPFLSCTLSTMRPPELTLNIKTINGDKPDLEGYRPRVDIILERADSLSDDTRKEDETDKDDTEKLDNEVLNDTTDDQDVASLSVNYGDVVNDNECELYNLREINSNVVETNTTTNGTREHSANNNGE